MIELFSFGHTGFELFIFSQVEGDDAFVACEN